MRQMCRVISASAGWELVAPYLSISSETSKTAIKRPVMLQPHPEALLQVHVLQKALPCGRVLRTLASYWLCTTAPSHHLQFSTTVCFSNPSRIFLTLGSRSEKTWSLFGELYYESCSDSVKIISLSVSSKPSRLGC